MDVFSTLPSELRVQILTHLRPNDVPRITRASPAMLVEHTKSRYHIARSMIPKDFDSELTQDAMAVLTFPVLDNEARREEMIAHRLSLWASKKFPNPIDTHDRRATLALDKLQILLRIFMGDYVAKAIYYAPCRGYHVLPSFSPVQEGIFDVDLLNPSERRRLFQAFLRFELLCRIYCPIDRLSMKMGGARWPWDWKRLSETGGARRMMAWELEALFCVHSYFESIYGTMMIQCNDALARIRHPAPPRWLWMRWRRQTPGLWTSSYHKGLTFFESCSADKLAHFGMELVVRWLRIANGGIGRCRHLGRNLNNFTDQVTNTFSELSPHTMIRFPCPRAPGSYRNIIKQKAGRLSGGWLTDVDVFRQRAWAFFDDDRLMPPEIVELWQFPGHTWQENQKRLPLYDHFQGMDDTWDDKDDGPSGEPRWTMARLRRLFSAKGLIAGLATFWRKHGCESKETRLARERYVIKAMKHDQVWRCVKCFYR